MNELDDVKKMLKDLKNNENAISMILGVVVVLVVGVMLFNFFKSNPNPTVSPESASTSEEGNNNYALETEKTETGQEVPKGLPVKHKVEKGQSLWAIAEKYYGSGYNWVDIAKENNMKNPSALEVGQEITVPKAAIKAATIAQTTKGGLTIGASGVSNKIEGDSYKVSKNDTLWSISVRAYGDGYQWTKVYNANKAKLHNANALEIGMELSLPR